MIGMMIDVAGAVLAVQLGTEAAAVHHLGGGTAMTGVDAEDTTVILPVTAMFVDTGESE